MIVPTDIQHCVSQARLNSGPLKPEGDWTGVFIRTDEAVTYVHLLHEVGKRLPSDEVSQALGKGLMGLRELLLSGFGK